MSAEKMREEFETWMKGSLSYLDLSRGNHGSYKSTTTHWLYCAWVASRDAISSPENHS